MVQDFTEDSYDPDHIADTDLENMEDNFGTLKSLFSGAASPPNAIAGMPWYHTTNRLLKIRNYNNTSWLGLMHADVNHKIPVYRNDQPDGWLIVALDTADMVIGIKSSGGTYSSGGAVAGSWQQPSAVLSIAQLPVVTPAGVVTGGNHPHTFGGGTPRAGSTGSEGYYGLVLSGGNKSTSLPISINPSGNLSMAFTGTPFGSGAAHDHGSAYRVRAAVCTLQYLNI